MAGTITESQLTARRGSAIRFALAMPADDSAIQRLLRDNPMRGAISVSFEREPNYFRGANITGAEDKTILAFEKGRLVCMGRCSIRDRYISGEVRRVGYLSDLRLDSSVQGRFDILRRGYQFFRELESDRPADFYFTSITADNARSIRFLERGLPGMPRYEPLADFVTLLIPVPRRAQRLKELNERMLSRLKSSNIEIVTALENHIYALVNLLNSHAKQFNLAAAWNEENVTLLQRHGLELSDFMVLMRAGEMTACASLWDQRTFKQVVIRGYNRKLSLVRPLLNLGSKLLGSPRLPSVGAVLAHGFLSPLAVGLDDKQSLLAMIEASLLSAAKRGMEFLTLGFDCRDPCFMVVRNHFRCREYRNRLFQVRWKNENSARLNLNENLLFPGVALL
ncbi:MAG TPA: hypothetical protein VNU95_01480 [Candidatus Acidoferrales bacterium]|jgi:hypothetical protein|nr:hypothetical protein [Candidatus Acidoferrales bacterium]